MDKDDALLAIGSVTLIPREFGFRSKISWLLTGSPSSSKTSTVEAVEI